MDYRWELGGVLIYLNDGVLDLDLAVGADCNHPERSLQIGDKIEDIALATVAYGPPGDLMDDGFFDAQAVKVLLSN